MQCSEARILLGPDPGPRPASPEVEDAFAHYRTCQGCQAFFDSHRRLAARLRRLSETQHAPDHLRHRIAAALAEETSAEGRVPPRRSARRWWAGGLVAAAAALAVWLSVARFDPMKPFVEEAFGQVDSESVLTTTDRAPLAEWFAGHDVPPFEIPDVAGAQLARARVTSVGGIRSAAIDFVMDGIELTYLMVPTQRFLDEMNESDIVSLSSDGYEVALWMEDGTSRAVVSSMPRGQLMAVAEQCKYKRTG